MVLIKSPIQKALVPLAIGSVMLLTGCGSDEPDARSSQTNLLVGDWNIVELGSYSYSPDDGTYLFRFESNKVFNLCYSYYDGTIYCEGEGNKGTWNWENAAEESVLIDIRNGGWTLDIDLMNADVLEGEINYDAAGQYDNTQSIKFVKVK